MKKIFLLFLVLICVACFNSENREKKQLALCKNAYHNRNYEKVLDYCEPLSKKGNDDATIMLALTERYNNNYEKAANLIQPLKNNNRVILIYGLTLALGDQPALGLEIIERTLKNILGDSEYDYILTAKYTLAEAYYTGKGIDRDYKKALKLFTEISESEILSNDIKSKIYLILGTSYFMGIPEDSPENNDIAYKYWQKAYKLENLGAKPLLVYDDLEKYFITMQAYKRFANNDDKRIEEYKNWLVNGKGQKYLIKKDYPAISAIDFLPCVYWYYEMGKQGYRFADYFLILHHIDRYRLQEYIEKSLKK